MGYAGYLVLAVVGLFAIEPVGTAGPAEDGEWHLHGRVLWPDGTPCDHRVDVGWCTGVETSPSGRKTCVTPLPWPQQDAPIASRDEQHGTFDVRGPARPGLYVGVDPSIQRDSDTPDNRFRLTVEDAEAVILTPDAGLAQEVTLRCPSRCDVEIHLTDQAGREFPGNDQAYVTGDGSDVACARPTEGQVCSVFCGRSTSLTVELGGVTKKIAVRMGQVGPRRVDVPWPVDSEWGRMEGVVFSGESGRPLEDVEVRLYRRPLAGRCQGVARTDVDGRYSFDRVPASSAWYLWVASLGREGNATLWMTPIRSEATSTVDLELFMKPCTTFAVDRGGAAVCGWTDETLVEAFAFP